MRQFFPKKADFTKLTHEQVREVEDNLNNRPRKMLKFRTPNEEFLRLALFRFMLFAVESAINLLLKLLFFGSKYIRLLNVDTARHPFHQLSVKYD